VGDLVAPERRLGARLPAEDLRGADCGGFAQVVLERFDPGAGLAAPVVVQVVAGNPEQPITQPLERAAEAGQGLDGADEGGPGEGLCCVWSAHGRLTPCSQSRIRSPR
jgi:hypothetical protein